VNGWSYYYPWSYYPLYWYYMPPPVDPMYLMMIIYHWITIPYYYMLMFEMYRTLINVWKKSVEELTKVTSEVKG